MAEKQKTSKVTKQKKQPASKKTMNLAFHKSEINPKILVPVILLIIVAGVAFAKFGFLDPLDKKTAALMDLSSRQVQLEMVNAKLTGYDEVAAEYGRYSYGWMTETESGLVDRMDILSIVEKTIAPTGTIDNFSIKDNVLSVTINGLTLQQTSALVKKLEAQDLVTSAAVYSAAAEDATLQAKVAMTIILEKGEN